MIGFKVGFGSPEARARLGIDRPLVAPLPASRRLPDGAAVAIGDWTAPVLEAEVAIWVGRGLGAAIELADVDFPPNDVKRIIAEGIYQRHVVLGEPVADSLEGVVARVLRNSVEVAATDDPTALTGDLDWVLETVELHAGRELSDGEVVIAGAVVPPQPVAPGERWRVDFGPLGGLVVTLT